MLNYSEKMFLALYKELYGKQYVCDKESKLTNDTIVVEHLQAQKATYLLLQCNILIGDYDFVWDKRGPFSAELQELLKGLDMKPKDVKRFYKLYNANTDAGLKLLLTEKQILRTRTLINRLKDYLYVEDDNKRSLNCELIGSLVYLSQTVLPGRSFDEVNNELTRRKGYLNDNAFNEKVWKVLRAADLLSV